jgi:hypothetical protein
MWMVGCSAPAGDEPIGAASQAITDGVVEPEVSGVIGVLDLDLHTLCSGVLVSDRVVVTARHCIAPASPENGAVDCAATKFGKENAPERIVITTSKDAAQPTNKHAVARVLVPDDDSFCNGDLAVLVLAQPLDKSEGTPIPLALDHEVAQGEAFTAIGIGRTDTDPSGTRRRRDGLRVQCVGEGCANAMVGSREWWGEGAVCEGDSGGPALDREGKVVGIASRKRAGCTATIYADVASNSDFFRASMGEAKATPTQPDVVKCSATPGKQGSGAIALMLGLVTLGARSRRALRRPGGSPRRRGRRAPRRSGERARDRGRGLRASRSRWGCCSK